MAEHILTERPVERHSPQRESDGTGAPKHETAEWLHAYAHELLKEMDGEQDKALAVATAGASMVGDGDLGVRSLFDVIGDLCGSAVPSNSLADVIDQLAGSPLDGATARERAHE